MTTDISVATSAALTAARTWTLPAANAVAAGKTITIDDTALGITTTNRLTITRAGSDTIDGVPSIVLWVPGSSLTLRSDGSSKWKIEALFGSPIGYCRVDRNSVTQSGNTGGANNLIQFTREIADYYGWFDNATNYRYTPKIAGVYVVILGIRAANNLDSPSPVVYKNGAVEQAGFYLNSGAGVGQIYLQTVAEVYCNGSTDYIDGRIYLPATITDISGDPAGTYMIISKK